MSKKINICCYSHCKLQGCRCRKLWMELTVESLISHPVSVRTATAGKSLLLQWSSLFLCGSPDGESLRTNHLRANFSWPESPKQEQQNNFHPFWQSVRQPTQLWLYSRVISSTSVNNIRHYRHCRISAIENLPILLLLPLFDHRLFFLARSSFIISKVYS